MDFLQSAFLGAVEGITEFLPVSSTGHLILISHVLGIASTEFVKSFEIAIQLGAIFAVVLLYWRKLFIERGVLARVVVAFVPTAVLGFFFYPFIKAYLLGNVSVVLWALFLGGVFLIVFEFWYSKKLSRLPVGGQTTFNFQLSTSLSDVTIRQAAIIGLCQSVSMIPGVSRAAATIVGGMLVGLSREAVVEFSFLLAIPTMTAATGLDLFKTSAVFSGNEWLLLAVGFISAFIFALLAVKFLLSFIKHHTFIGFGIYRICAAALFFLFLF
jgi:undecaprenyl-diphosphatase